MPNPLLLGPVYQALCLECGWALWAKKPCSSAGIYHGANRSREKLCVFQDTLLPSDLGRMARVLHRAALLVLPSPYQTKPPPKPKSSMERQWPSEERRWVWSPEGGAQ